MKKQIYLLTVFMFFIVGSYAQNNSNNESSFNKWTIEGNLGVTKPYRNFNSGYFSQTPDFFSGNIGTRYMFNEYLGLKLDFGYNEFTNGEGSLEFSTDYYRSDLQAVLNMGRLLKFESWTKSLNILTHAGLGVGHLNYDENPSARDYVGNAIAGITGQIRLSDKLTLNMDVSGLANLKQDYSFNGGTANDKNIGVVFNGTAGLAYNLGGKKEHADWYVNEDESYSNIDSRISSIDIRVKETSAMVENTQSELEKIKESLAALNTKLEDFDFTPSESVTPEQVAVNNQASELGMSESLINNGFVNVFFDFNSTNIDKACIGSVNFIKNYMLENPDVSIKLTGFADEQGVKAYNQLLSKKRAEAVSTMLINSGIAESRIEIEGKGVDSSVAGSAATNQLARRVSFTLNGQDITNSNKSEAGSKLSSTPTTTNKNEFTRTFLDVDLQSVHFVENKSYLTDFSKGRLDKLITLLSENPDYYIDMYAYTDATTESDIDEEICTKRMAAVTNYIASKGLDKSRVIRTEVMGSVNPVASNDTEQGRLLNRRIEFEVYEAE